MQIPAGIVFVVCGAFAISGCSLVSQDSPGATPQSPKLTQTTETGLQSSDQAMAGKNLQAALENSLSGKPQRWENPASGASGSATPLKTWKNDDGAFCRSYTERYRLASGQSVNREGSACRMSNAVWKII
ncbi:RT0821/Lpp0805 family surface protein [Roseibium sp. M-1]